MRSFYVLTELSAKGMNEMANTTIEQTNKKYKAMGCLGTIVALSGAVMAFRGMVSDNEVLLVAGSVLFVLGFVVVIAARIGKWWNND